LPKEDLADFVKSASSLRSSLQEALKKHGVGSRVDVEEPPVLVTLLPDMQS